MGSQGGHRGGDACADKTGLVQPRLEHVVWLAAAELDTPERQALRLVCRVVREALDAAPQPWGLTIKADGLPEGDEGAQQLARYFGRPG